MSDSEEKGRVRISSGGGGRSLGFEAYFLRAWAMKKAMFGELSMPDGVCVFEAWEGGRRSRFWFGSQ